MVAREKMPEKQLVKNGGAEGPGDRGKTLI